MDIGKWSLRLQTVKEMVLLSYHFSLPFTPYCVNCSIHFFSISIPTTLIWASYLLSGLLQQYLHMYLTFFIKSALTHLTSLPYTHLTFPLLHCFQNDLPKIQIKCLSFAHNPSKIFHNVYWKLGSLVFNIRPLLISLLPISVTSSPALASHVSFSLCRLNYFMYPNSAGLHCASLLPPSPPHTHTHPSQSLLTVISLNENTFHFAPLILIHPLISRWLHLLWEALTAQSVVDLHLLPTMSLRAAYSNQGCITENPYLAY